MAAVPIFTDLDPKSQCAIRELAIDWRDSPMRPRLSEEVVQHWDRLIEEWVNEPTVPLLIRKGGNRGELFYHNIGRPLVIVDNSPANWCFASALLGRCPTLPEIHKALENHDIPVAMIFKKEELPFATYRGSLGRTGDIPNLNSLGWKVCHINSVGLNNRTSAAATPISSLIQQTRAFLNPRNMFLVPKIYGGLGELPEFLHVFLLAAP